MKCKYFGKYYRADFCELVEVTGPHGASICEKGDISTCPYKSDEIYKQHVIVEARNIKMLLEERILFDTTQHRIIKENFPDLNEPYWDVE